MEDVYLQDRDAFTNSAFWASEEYVGAGPYRLTRWDRGVAMSLAANPYFAMGKPKIEAIEILFTNDMNAATASLLAGALDFAEYHAIDIQQALVLKEQWGAGRILANPAGARYLEFQYRDVPNHQPVVTDVRVRRGLMHAIDREALAGLRTGGLGTVADTGHPQGSPVFPSVDAAISKYPFDGRRLQAVLGEAGWTKGPEGLFRDASGRSLDVTIWGSSEEEQEVTTIADDWKRAGINSSEFIMSRSQRSDFEFRVSFPAVTASSGREPIAADRILWEKAPTPENRYRGPNRGSYHNPEVDRLYYLVQQMLDPAERTNATVELERVFTADVGLGMLFYIVRPAAVRNEIKGIRPEGFVFNDFTHLWNVWEWTIET
jgi:peptide/nickel transport system substrate-binding protein